MILRYAPHTSEIAANYKTVIRLNSNNQTPYECTSGDILEAIALKIFFSICFFKDFSLFSL